MTEPPKVPNHCGAGTLPEIPTERKPCPEPDPDALYEWAMEEGGE